MRPELQLILAEGSKKADGMTFLGYQVNAMERDELLALVGWLAELREREQRQHMESSIASMRALAGRGDWRTP